MPEHSLDRFYVGSGRDREARRSMPEIVWSQLPIYVVGQLLGATIAAVAAGALMRDKLTATS